MTFRFIESWKTYPVGGDQDRRWPWTYGGGATITEEGCRINGSDVRYIETFFQTTTRIMTGFWFRPEAFAPSVNNSSTLHFQKDGNTNSSNQIGLGVNPDGTISVFRGSNFGGFGGTTLANGSRPMLSSRRYWIELDCVFGTGTAGSFKLKIDNETDVDLAGIDTSPLGGGANNIAFTAGAGAIHVVGGMYLGDGDEGFLGPCEVERLYPASFTTEPNPNYTLEDDQFDATYIADGGGADAVFSGLIYNPLKVHAVQATRPLPSNSAYVSIDQLDGSVPEDGIMAPADSLYVEALISKTYMPPVNNGRRRFSAIPG